MISDEAVTVPEVVMVSVVASAPVVEAASVVPVDVAKVVASVVVSPEVVASVLAVSVSVTAEVTSVVASVVVSAVVTASVVVLAKVAEVSKDKVKLDVPAVVAVIAMEDSDATPILLARNGQLGVYHLPEERGLQGPATVTSRPARPTANKRRMLKCMVI